MDYVILETKSGSKTIIKKNNGSDRDIKLHSAYDPVKESERSVDAFNAGKCSIIAVSGIALGYHINALKKKYPATNILAIENDQSIIELCKKHNPSALENIIPILNENDLAAYFQTIDLSSFQGVAHYIHRPSYNINPDFYETVLANMKLLISSRVSDLLTRFEFEEKWIKNIFTNLKWLGRAAGVSSFFNKFKNYPGIIVSAGPSLRKDLDIIRDLKDSAVIICVDTAFKVLTKAGIEPHFVMTLDAQKYSFKHFTGVKPQNTVLVSDMVSCPAILDYYSGNKIISTTSKYYQDSTGKTLRETTPVMDWIEKFTESPGDIQSGGSVATSAFDLLLNMGCNPIILLGQDLAYTGREIHCSGTYHNDDWLPQINRYKNLDTINQNVIRKRKIKYVPKFNKDGKVISDFVFDLYKSWFEDSASRVNVRVINSNSGGAYIANTQEIPATKLSLKPAEETPFQIIERIFSKTAPADIHILIQKINYVNQQLNLIASISESDKSANEKYSLINNLLNEDDLNSLLKPFMRKAEFYTSRHLLDNEKIQEMIYNEVCISSSKLKRFISRLFKINQEFSQEPV